MERVRETSQASRVAGTPSLLPAHARPIARESAAHAELSHVDAHAAVIEANPPRVWRAIGEVLAHERLPGRGRVARLLGAEPATRCGDPLVAGSTLPGFRITRADAPSELALEGRHRFASYVLLIRVTSHEGGSVISAESRARFFGVGGQIYRALVVGARTHTLVVRTMLAGIRAHAESATA